MKSLLSCLAWLLLLFLPALGHDTQVLLLRFQELGDERYQLDYLAPPGSPQGDGIPQLPAHATWEQQPGLPVGPVRLLFTTDGKPLSAEDRVILPWRCPGVMVHAFWKNGETSRKFFPRSDDGIVLTLAEMRVGAASPAEAVRHYTTLGVEHFLTGWDHLLFVAGLLLLVRGWKQVIATLTAFTLAHSLTLGLASLGWLHVHAGIVEVLIALSIAILGVEILQVRQGKPGLTARRPWLISFGFGLIHGLGFAGVMADLGLPTQDLPLALLCFNIGVELGQMAMVLVWLSLAAGLRHFFRFRFPEKWGWLPGYALGVIAMIWCLDRTLSLFS